MPATLTRARDTRRPVPPPTADDWADFAQWLASLPWVPQDEPAGPTPERRVAIIRECGNQLPF